MNGNGSRDTSEGAEAGKWALKNMNSIMLFIVLAVLGFLGNIGWNNSITLAEMKGGIVTKSELEAKLAEIRTSQLALEKDLTALKLALAERGITQKQR